MDILDDMMGVRKLSAKVLKWTTIPGKRMW